MRKSGREVALALLKSSWDAMEKMIDAGQANKDDHDYDFHKTLFERSLSYVESYDIKYLKDGIYKTQEDRDE